MRMPAILGLAMRLAALVVAAAPALAREEIPAENRAWRYKADLRACDAEDVLSRIRSRFAHVEKTFWSSNAEIVAIDKIRQSGFRPDGLDLIPRRYCQAVATMSDRRRLTLRYEIIEDGGIVGITYGVQFCLDGYDRNHLAMPGCARLDR